jgi:hypothetical protein
MDDSPKDPGPPGYQDHKHVTGEKQCEDPTLLAVTFSGPPVSDKSCPTGLVKVADIVENNLLFTFSDLSVLYGNGSGVVCIDPANLAAPPVAEIDGTWDGGTERFENAGGTWSLRFDAAVPIGIATPFIAEAGAITGHFTGVD